MKSSFVIFLITLLLTANLQAGERTIEDEILNPPRGFTENDLHKYLGVAAITAGTLAGTLFRPNSDKDYGTHESVANIATALAVASVASGFYSHTEDLNIDFGITDPDNQHILLGLLGAGLMAYSVADAPDSSHAGPGMAGLALMAISVKITW